MVNMFDQIANSVETSYARQWFERATEQNASPISPFPGSQGLGSRKRRDNWERDNATLPQYLSVATDDLRDRRRECYRRSRWTFTICVALAMFSALSVYFIAIFSTFNPVTERAIVPELGTLLSACATGLAYRMYRIEADRADKIDRDLLRLEMLRISYLTGDRDPAELIRHIRLEPSQDAAGKAAGVADTPETVADE